MFFIHLYICFSAASGTTITGWADALHTVYIDIGGYYPFSFLSSSVVVLMFLILSLLLDRFRHNLRSMDYFKLLRVNLEHQSLISLNEFLVLSLFLLFLCLTFAFVEPSHVRGS
jgi:hypothetical protein